MFRWILQYMDKNSPPIAGFNLLGDAEIFRESLYSHGVYVRGSLDIKDVLNLPPKNLTPLIFEKTE